MDHLELAQQRYSEGAWRAHVFRDLILSDCHQRQRPMLLDIGCGYGFDGSRNLQVQLAEEVKNGEFYGVEPDLEASPSPIFSKVYRSTFEQAPIPAASIDVAFCVMVLEHIASPALFFEKLASCLKPGGVFWGFTIDARHPFVFASKLIERLRFKNAYLNLLHGRPDEGRYQNYETHYRANTYPAATNGLDQRVLREAIHEFLVTSPARFLLPALAPMGWTRLF